MRSLSLFFCIIIQEFLLELISIGAEVSLPASSGNTSLHFAAINNRKAVVEVLIRSGADPSTPNGEGVIAGELCTDAEIRALLLRDPSQLPTMIGGLSPFALTRQHMRALVEAQDRSPHRMLSPNHATTVTDSPIATNGTVDRFVIHSQMMSPDHSGIMMSGHEADDDDDGLQQRGLGHLHPAVQDDDDEELRELQEAILAAATETTVVSTPSLSFSLSLTLPLGLSIFPLLSSYTHPLISQTKRHHLTHHHHHHHHIIIITIIIIIITSSHHHIIRL